MNMTKRDIADIVLVWLAISFVFSLLTSIVTLGFYISMSDEALQYTDKSTAITFQVINLLFILFLNYLLLFKRPLILSFLFPDGQEKEVSIPEGITALASYSFWIKLLGITSCLTSSIAFLGQLVSDVAIKRQYPGGPFWVMQSGSHFVSAILAIIVIWNAKWISEKLTD